MGDPRRLIQISVSCFLSGFLLAGCDRNGGGAASGGRSGAGGKVPVLVAEVVRKPVPISLKSVGHVLSQDSVTVKPQVPGQIAEVHFREGQDVEKGALLFTIDPRTYKAALDKNSADLEKAKAVAADAELRAGSFAKLELKAKGSVATDEVNRYKASAATARADVIAAEAAVKTTQLMLDYCTITAPQAGRTGAVLVDPGNIVQAGITELVVINQIAPVEVSFSVAGQYLGDLMHYMQKGKLKVEALPEGRRSEPATGEVVFMNNQVNRIAGTVELKALFQNTDHALWPGQFVDVEVFLTTEPDRVVVPVRAVQTGQEGTFVFLVNENLAAVAQQVKVARTTGEEAIVAEGLNGGERVVIDGQSQLTDGSVVNILPSLDAAAQKPDKEKPAPRSASRDTPAGKP